MTGNFSEFEPKPNLETSIDFDTEMKQAVLREALQQFSDTILEDDTLFGLVRNKLLEKSEGDASRLPEFSLSPNIKNGTRSIQISTSMQADAGEHVTDEGSVASFTFTFGTYKYIRVCDLSENEEGNLSIAVKKEFAELVTGKDLASDNVTEEEARTIENSARTFMRAINDIASYCEERGVEVLIDDFGRPEVKEILERTFTESDLE